MPTAAVAAAPRSELKRRKLNLKAQFDGDLSYYSFKRLVPGSFNDRPTEALTAIHAEPTSVFLVLSFRSLVNWPAHQSPFELNLSMYGARNNLIFSRGSISVPSSI
jgi:hypothetical protein